VLHTAATDPFEFSHIFDVGNNIDVFDIRIGAFAIKCSTIIVKISFSSPLFASYLDIFALVTVLQDDEPKGLSHSCVTPHF
jgi:hypothetical protein